MSADAQALAERVVHAMMAKDAFSRWLGIELVAVAPHAATVRMTIREDMLNGFGVCHGGIPFALADSALAFASNTHGRVTVSIDNAISYPAPIRGGDVLVAEARLERATSRLGFYGVTVRREGDREGDGAGDAGAAPVALFRGTVYDTQKPYFTDIE